MSQRRNTGSRASQQGASLLIFALVLISAVLGFFLTRLNSLTLNTQRDQITSDALAQAKEALIGFAATYRDTHPDSGNNNDKLLGYLPCPDTDNDGTSDSCGATDVSLIGRLPWKTLGLPPLRDGSGECLWYAVSGHAKDTPKTDVLNWDTLGQFIVRDADGTILAGTSAHERPLAVILAPRPPLGTQTRLSAGASECGGSNTPADYLEGIGTLGTGDTTLTLASTDSIRNGTNNDRGLTISGPEIFERIKKRQDFAGDITTLLDKLKNELDGIPAASLPTGLTTVLGTSGCPLADTVSDQKDAYFRCNWSDNLKYFASPPAPPSPVTINGASCNAALFFSGERVAGQSRATAADKLIASNYLEGASSTVFSVGGNYTFNEVFNYKLPGTDLARCIQGLPPGSIQKSFAADFGSFSEAGPSGAAAITPDVTDKTVTITDASGTGNGCFWLSTSLPLGGRTMRGYYEFQFTNADTFALTGSGSDRGNGFTFQIVNSDPGSPPFTCGQESNMGALSASAFSDPMGSLWGWRSFIIETDVHKDTTRSDTTQNHTAILLNGTTTHAVGSVTTACNGTAGGCAHSPANKFEESPTPLRHNQRIEIHTGCDAACSSCTPASYLTKTRAKISVWVDCVDCINISTDFHASELISATENRDFSAPGSWTGSNWSVVSGAFSHTTGTNAATLPNSALGSPPVAASTYTATTTVSTDSAGTVSISFGGTSSGPISLPIGVATLTVQLSAVSTAPLTITPDASWTGSIDNVSITPWNVPTIQRCVDLDSSMNAVYLGFTGGFRGTSTTAQGVTISNFYLRID